MSNQKKIRKSRQTKTTHFVEEVVTMCALNDPLPPYHPQTPPSPHLHHQVRTFRKERSKNINNRYFVWAFRFY